MTDRTNGLVDDLARANLAIALAAAAMRVDVGKVAGDSRELQPRIARQVAMYLAYAGLGLSLARTAAVFNRDRSTVAHACRVIEDRRDDPEFDRWLAALEEAVARVPVVA